MNGDVTSTGFPPSTTRCGRGWSARGPDSEPPIDLDTMLDLTANAAVDGVKFDGVDLFLFDPHVSIDASDDDLKRLADRIRARICVVGSLVAPVWPPTGGGSAMGDADERRQFVTQVRKACRIGKKLRDLGHPHVRRRPHRLGREPGGVGEGSGTATRRRSPRPSARRATSPKAFGERLAAEGEICWGGMHSWKRNRRAARTGRPAADARLPGRHGAHAAVHAGLQRARGSAAAREASTGQRRERSTRR